MGMRLFCVLCGDRRSRPYKFACEDCSDRIKREQELRALIWNNMRKSDTIDDTGEKADG